MILGGKGHLQRSTPSFCASSASARDNRSSARLIFSFISSRCLPAGNLSRMLLNSLIAERLQSTQSLGAKLLNAASLVERSRLTESAPRFILRRLKQIIPRASQPLREWPLAGVHACYGR